MSLNGENGRKVYPLEELASVAAKLRTAGRKLVHCHGVFDLLHPGHIRHLGAARKRGDVLVVTVTQDRDVNKGPGRPVFNEELRAESLASLACVDYVAISRHPTAVPAIETIRPHFYVKGADYRDKRKDVTGGIGREERAARSVGAELVITDEPLMSSSRLLNRHFSPYPPATREYLASFSRRFGGEGVLRQLEGLKGLKVLVVGEAIVDEYFYCQAMGKSPKETIVSTRFVEAETFAGGALAAANHLASFASDVRLVSSLGEQNDRSAFIRSHLRPNVRPAFFTQKGASTIIKRRFVEPAFLTKMFEMSYLDDKPIDAKVERALEAHLRRELQKADLVLVTDYGHGLMTPRLLDLVCRKAPYLAVNTQANSANMGFNVVTKYPRADLVCIDEPEIRLAGRDRHGGVEDLILGFARKMRARRFIVTRGHRGAMTWTKAGGFVSIPVFSLKVVDRTGAGDAFLALASLASAGGLDPEVCAFVGNAAGALHVGTVCNREPVEKPALYKFISAMLA